MITDQKKAVNGRTNQGQTLVRCQKTRLCRCGQELEDHSREHCPRCGTTLH